MSNTMPLSGGAVLKGDKSAVARRGANLLGPGEAMAERSRRRMKAASVSISQQVRGVDRRERAERGSSDGGAQARGRQRMKEEKEAPAGRGARKMA